MDFPLKRVTAAAAAIAYVATWALGQGWTPSAFFSRFAGSWVICFACWTVWAVILYPKCFSPLVGLPEPKNPSWLHGQYFKIREQPTGWPMLEW